MARPHRTDHENGWHHVMNRGADHGPVFLGDSDRIEFGSRLADIHERFGVETHAYCLLDTHYHLLLHCPHGKLSDAMQRLGSIYTRHVNDRIGRDGALFRGRFHSKVIDDDRYLLAAARYVHRNALDVSGVSDVDGYRWSSHRAYLGLRRAVPWLRTDVVLSQFDGDRSAFHEFVSSDGTGPSRAPGGDDLAAVLRAADLVVLELGLGEHGHGAVVARSIAVSWSDGLNTVDATTLMTVLGIPSAGALRVARSRARRRAQSDPLFARAVVRAAELAAAPMPLHRGSDPWCNGQSAASAAS